MAGIPPKGPRKPHGTNWRQVVDDYKQKIDGAGGIRVPAPKIEGAVERTDADADEGQGAMVVSVASTRPQDGPDLKFLEEALSLPDHRNGDASNENRNAVTPWYQLNRKRFDDAGPADQGSVRYRSEDTMVSPVSLRKIQDSNDRNHLDGIANLVLALTYGEMIDLANGIWKAQPEGTAITQDNLPALLHRWSKAHVAAGNKAGPEEPLSS